MIEWDPTPMVGEDVADPAEDYYADYAYLRGDQPAALQQIWSEIHTALDTGMFTDQSADGRVARRFLQGLRVKAELGMGMR